MAENFSPFSKEHHQFAITIIERLENNFGTPLKDLFFRDVPIHQIRADCRAAIKEAALRMCEKERPSEDWPLAGDPKYVLAVFDVENIIPPIAVTKHNLDIIRGYSGDDLSDYVKTVANRLSLIHDGQSPEEVAIETIGSGLAGFTAVFILKTAYELSKRVVLRTAVTAGVKAAGGAVSLGGAAAVIIIELLFYFAVSNQKSFVGMVYNNTDDDLVVTDWRLGISGKNLGDLYTAHGTTNGFMQAHPDGDLAKPAVQILARQAVGGNEVALICGGIYSAQKNVGFMGSEGVLVFHSQNQPLPRFALLFACPYSKDNGANVAIDNETISAKTYFDRLSDKRGIDKSAAYGSYKFQAKVAQPRGGEALGIAVLDQS